MTTTTTNYGLTLHEGTDKPGAAFKQDNANMNAIDAALADIASAQAPTWLPVGAVVMMYSQTNPHAAGAPGTWQYLFKATVPLSGSSNFLYYYRRTA